MAEDSGGAPQRGMSFPFFLSLLLFAAVLADRYLTAPGFVASAAWRQQPYILAGLVVTAFLLWFWVLAASRRRNARFYGPVQHARGSNGALQPILATIVLVVAANLAHAQSLPKWLNFFLAEGVTTETFTLSGDVAPPGRGCSLAAASHPRYGDVELCLPAPLAVEAGPGAVLSVTGTASWFGLEPRRYALAGAPVAGPGPLVVPAEVAVDDVERLDAILGTEGEASPAPAGKTGRSPRN